MNNGMNLDEIFRTYDIRGRSPELLNPDLAYKIGRALADCLDDSGPVAVGRDMRPESANLAGSLMKGLMHQGREVWDLGLITTDMMYFAVGKHQLAGGAMVTASHNQAGDNGIKLSGKGALPISLATGMENIKTAIEKGSYKDSAPTPGRVIQKQLDAEWLAHVFDFVDASKWQPLKVAFDAGNGMMGCILPSFAKRTPLEITEVFYELDGNFPNRPSDPTVPKNLKQLQQTVKTKQLDLGVAFDGDGDRVIFVDETGKVLSPNLIAAILTSDVLKKEPGATIVTDVRSSRLIELAAKEAGGKVVRAKVGNPFIAAAMKKHNGLFGAELAAHYYFRQNYFIYSGLIAAALVIDVLARSGKKLSQLAGQYQQYFQSGEINFKVKDKQATLKKVEEEFRDGTQSWPNGLTVDYPDWWFNLRPSNTEDLLRLNVEAANQSLLNQKVALLSKIISA